jgi:hypothetical protein
MKRPEACRTMAYCCSRQGDASEPPPKRRWKPGRKPRLAPISRGSFYLGMAYSTWKSQGLIAALSLKEGYNSKWKKLSASIPV